jgi:deoxyribonuclease V
VVVLSADTGVLVEAQTAVADTPFPYVPGLLTFREGPVLLEAFAKVESDPDAVIFDGQGVAHPRRIGLAAHMGLWLDKPCIGCAKTRLIGTYREPGKRPGAVRPLLDGDEVIGHVVRTKKKVKPLFVSVRHRIDLASAVRVVLGCCRGYRIPEPTRQAHLHVNALRRQGGTYGQLAK